WARSTRSTCSSSEPVRSGSSRRTTAASEDCRSASWTPCPSSAARSPRCTPRRTSSTSPASPWSRARTSCRVWSSRRP
ncbi:MAG: Thioredoxin reductase, partial [uncultured Nocardioidaceae bacterium]